MKPVSLPDGAVPDGLRYTVVKPAEGDEDNVKPCPAYIDSNGAWRILIELDEIDLAQLNRQESFWLVMHGAQMSPWSLEHIVRTSDLGSVLCMACGKPTEPSQLVEDTQGRFGHRSCIGAGLRPVPTQEVEGCSDNSGKQAPTS